MPGKNSTGYPGQLSGTADETICKCLTLLQTVSTDYCILSQFVFQIGLLLLLDYMVVRERNDTKTEIPAPKQKSLLFS